MKSTASTYDIGKFQKRPHKPPPLRLLFLLNKYIIQSVVLPAGYIVFLHLEHVSLVFQALPSPNLKLSIKKIAIDLYNLAQAYQSITK